jgi:hypothetical protein
MLKRNKQLLIPSALTVKGQGETIKFDLVFHNRSSDDLDAKMKEKSNTYGDTIMYIVESWDSEYPLTREGLIELDNDRPGILLALLDAYHDARRMHREKN